MHPRLLVVTTLGFSGAFLTKSWHAILVLVIAAAYLLLRGQWDRIRPRHLAAAAGGLVPIVAWAVARSSVDGTRFFTAMIRYDLLTRSSHAIEGHVGGPLFYVPNVLYVAPWLLMIAVPIAMRVLGRGHRSTPPALPDPAGWRRSEWLGPAVWAVVVFCAFTLASSKLAWYLDPIYPALALLIGLLAAALARDPRRASRVALCAALVVSGAITEGYLLVHLVDEGRPIPAQVALDALRGTRDQRGLRIYLDPSLAVPPGSQPAVSRIGDWPEGLRATALMTDDLDASDGGPAAFASRNGPALVLIRRGSPADEALDRSGVSRIASSGQVELLEGR